jgi:hypothetical protein
MDRYLSCLEEDIVNSKRELDILNESEQQFSQESEVKRKEFNMSLELSTQQEDACRKHIIELRDQLREAQGSLCRIEKTRHENCQGRENMIGRERDSIIKFDHKRSEIMKTLQELQTEKQKFIERTSRINIATTVTSPTADTMNNQTGSTTASNQTGLVTAPARCHNIDCPYIGAGFHSHYNGQVYT